MLPIVSVFKYLSQRGKPQYDAPKNDALLIMTRNRLSMAMGPLWSCGCAVLIMLVVVCNTAASAYQKSNDLTLKDAASLARIVVQHQIENIENKGNFSLTEFSPEPDDRFYTFEALGVWSSAPGSAVIGHYSVNKKTGDVWDLFICAKVQFNSLQKLQARYFHQLNSSSDNAVKSLKASPRPVLCDF